MDDKTSSPQKNAAIHANLLKRDELSLGIKISARSLVIWEISCATQTKMKVLMMMLSTGFPGMSTKIPLVSAASHMWYWQMNNWEKQALEVRYVQRVYYKSQFSYLGTWQHSNIFQNHLILSHSWPWKVHCRIYSLELISLFSCSYKWGQRK